MEYKALVNFLILGLRVVNRMSILVNMLNLREYEFFDFHYCHINIYHFQTRDGLAVFFSIHSRPPLFLRFHVEELNQLEVVLSIFELLRISHFELVYQYLIKTALSNVLARLVLLILFDDDTLGGAIVANNQPRFSRGDSHDFSYLFLEVRDFALLVEGKSE